MIYKCNKCKHECHMDEQTIWSVSCYKCNGTYNFKEYDEDDKKKFK